MMEQQHGRSGSPPGPAKSVFPPTAPPTAAELIDRTGWLIKLRWVAIVGVLLTLETVQRVFREPLALRPMQLVMALLTVHNLLLALVVRRWRWDRATGELPACRLGNVLLCLALAPVYVLRTLLSVRELLRQSSTHALPGASASGASGGGVLTRFLVPQAWRGLDQEQESCQAAVVASAQMLVDLAALAALIHFAGGMENPFVFFFIFHVIISSILLSRRATFLNTTFAFVLACGIGIGELLRLLAHYPLLVLGRHGQFQNPVFVAAQLFVLGTTLYLAAYMASSIVAHLRRYEREAVFLSQELTARAEELEVVCARLSLAEKAKSQYLRKVAHELKSPLATVQAVLRVVLDGLAGPISEKAREMIERAERRSGELAQATQDLLTLARARDGQPTAEMVAVDVGEMAAEVVEDLHDQAQQASLTLTLDRTLTVGRIVADPIAIRQLIRNLIGNAIRYNRSGGAVKVRVAEANGHAVQIEVEDTGIGISARDLTRVFDEFFRSETARKHVAGGTGLGLAIVKAVAEQHRGEVSVRSTPGEGSCFSVRLPRELPDQRPDGKGTVDQNPPPRDSEKGT